MYSNLTKSFKIHGELLITLIIKGLNSLYTYLFQKSRLRSFHKEILHADDPAHFIGQYSKELLNSDDPNEFIKRLAFVDLQKHRLKMVTRRTWFLSATGAIITGFAALMTFNEPVRKIVIEKGFQVLSIVRPTERLLKVVRIPRLVPDSLDFCGEQVPLGNHLIYKKMRSAILENRYTRSSDFKRKAARWFRVISPILAKNGIPEDFKYIPLVETEFVNAVSPRGAAGFWQFMPATARLYGLTVNENVDERLNVELETRAACKYLKDLHRRTGSWTLAAAAYNMGLGGLENKVNRQNNSDYYSLSLNKETSKYIYKTVAFKHFISKNKPLNTRKNPRRFKRLSRKPIKAKNSPQAPDFQKLAGLTWSPRV